MEESTFPLIGKQRSHARGGETEGQDSDLGARLDGCLCHVYKDERGELTQLTERSWRSFVRAGYRLSSPHFKQARPF